MPPIFPHLALELARSRCAFVALSVRINKRNRALSLRFDWIARDRTRGTSREEVIKPRGETYLSPAPGERPNSGRQCNVTRAVASPSWPDRPIFFPSRSRPTDEKRSFSRSFGVGERAKGPLSRYAIARAISVRAQLMLASRGSNSFSEEFSWNSRLDCIGVGSNEAAFSMRLCVHLQRAIGEIRKSQPNQFILVSCDN